MFLELSQIGRAHHLVTLKLEKKNKFVYDVDKFVEKPDLKKAKAFFNDEKFYWNSGMFLFSTKTLIREMNLYSKKDIRAL